MNDQKSPEVRSTEVSPNTRANMRRHSRIFLRSVIFSRGLFRLLLDLKGFSRSLERKFRSNSLLQRVIWRDDLEVQDPFKKFFRQAAIFTVALFVVTSVAPGRMLDTGFTADFFDVDSDVFLEETEADVPFLMNEEGFILKPTPVSEETSRVGLTDSVRHTVVSGDTCSGIASLYGINVATLRWENNIGENCVLQVGRTLVIPPINGVSHKVAAGESLRRIANLYGVEISKITEHNGITTVKAGQTIFIPDGKKRESVAARSGVRSGDRASVNTFDPKVVVTGAEPRNGKSFLFPTSGITTQSYRAGHYGVDIANPAKPDVLAMGDATILEVTTGCTAWDVKLDRQCGHRWGNMVLLDLGDGYQSRSAHLETVYVTVGQKIVQGQALGKMGNTGWTWGQTGIHVHQELYKDGERLNPANYW